MLWNGFHAISLECRIDQPVVRTGKSAFTMSKSAIAIACDRSCLIFPSLTLCQMPGAQVWWSQTGSNRRPHACKARALPTELWPRCLLRIIFCLSLAGLASLPALSRGMLGTIFNLHGKLKMVGLGRLELPTSRLSSARSNQLSYKPDEASSSGARTIARGTATEKEGKRRRRQGANCLMSKLEEARESSLNYRSLERR